MGFKAASEEAEKEYAEQKAEEFEDDGDQEPIVSLTQGPNVFWVLPRIDEMPSPLMRKLVHYAPFHACMRKDPVRDLEDPNNDYKRDDFFYNCYRCGQTWDVYDDNDQPKEGAEYSKFLDDMSDEQIAFNAVDLTSFFDFNSRDYAVPNTDLIDRWGGTFVKVVRGEIKPPENMPEEMAEHAVASPSPVLVSDSKVGSPLDDKIFDKRQRSDSDPLLHPEDQLIEIHKEYTGETFKSRGQEQQKCEYTIRFTLDNQMEDFEMPDGLMEAAEEQALDLANPTYEPDDDEEWNLQDKMRSLVKPTEDELKQYLEEAGHSFRLEEGGESEGEPDDGGSDEKFSDDDDAMSAEQKSKVDDVTSKMHPDDE